MELNFDKITRLKKIRIEKSKLSEEENNLTRPILSDKKLIYEIYKIFVDLQNERNCPPSLDSSTQRKKFIFIILYMFSPGTLAGGRIPKGLRKIFEEVFSNVNPCTISNNLKNVIFLYQHYKNLRQDIEYLYSEILNRLKFEGLINE